MVRPYGLTLIELLVALTILGFLMALGVPAMSTYLQNAKVASAAQNLQAGLAFARLEAIRRNAPVEFVLTNSDVGASGVADTVVPSGAGVNWLVRAPQMPPSVNFDLLDAKRGGEGEGQAAAPAVLIAASGVFGGTIAFNGIGGTATGTAYTFNLSNPAAGACAAASGPIRCRRVHVSAGGRVRSCDPAVADVNDSRMCVGP
jgi:type IV fimbrial biogenesis protein FimT